ncbi:MAG: arginine--tRNA ligase, partial [Chloroflexi bacterium]|nr:arginine--tRNA ligase [Chloroflexota bacterium]
MAMIRDEIVLLLEQAVSEAQERELIPRVSLVDVTVERPQNAEHGDYATSLPLKLARAARMDPMVIANHLADLFSSAPFIEKVEVAAPGFINLTLKGSWLSQQVEAILEAAETYGNRDLGQGQKVQVEFVSGNPTGPLHVGHGRHAVLGSVLANVLAAAGYAVDKEYYLNDAGSQIDAFYRSLYVRYQQHWGLSVAMPPDGYMGEYMVELAQEIAAEEGDRFLAFPEPEGLRELGKLGMTKIIQAIRADLELMRVEFDNWFSEASLYEGGQYKEALVRLEREGYIKEKEGAVWFVSSALGDDKDNVVVRSSGVPTYFASDIAY